MEPSLLSAKEGHLQVIWTLLLRAVLGPQPSCTESTVATVSLPHYRHPHPRARGGGVQSEWWVLPHYPTQEGGGQRYRGLGGRGPGSDVTTDWRESEGPPGCLSLRLAGRHGQPPRPSPPSGCWGRLWNPLLSSFPASHVTLMLHQAALPNVSTKKKKKKKSSVTSQKTNANLFEVTLVSFLVETGGWEAAVDK